MLSNSSRMRMYRLPRGKASRTTRAVSSGTGSGWWGRSDISILLRSRHLSAGAQVYTPFPLPSSLFPLPSSLFPLLPTAHAPFSLSHGTPGNSPPVSDAGESHGILRAHGPPRGCGRLGGAAVGRRLQVREAISNERQAIKRLAHARTAPV